MPGNNQTDNSDVTINPDGSITVPGQDHNSGTTNDNITIKPNKPNENPTINPDGSVTVPQGGGSITTPQSGDVQAPAGSVINPNGTITLPGKDNTSGNKDDITIKPGANGSIILPGVDGNINNQKDNIVVKPSSSEEKPIINANGTITIPNGGGSITTPQSGDVQVPAGSIINPNGTITLPGKDNTIGNKDDITIKPNSNNSIIIPGPNNKLDDKDDLIIKPINPQEKPIINANGTITAPQGGAIIVKPNGTQIEVSGDSIINSDGTINTKGELTSGVRYLVQQSFHGWVSQNPDKHGILPDGSAKEKLSFKYDSFNPSTNSNEQLQAKDVIPAYNGDIEGYQKPNLPANAGITAKDVKTEAFALWVDKNQVPDYDPSKPVFNYSVQVENRGWLDPVHDGQQAGTVGSGQRIEAFNIQLTDDYKDKYDLYYRIYTYHYGWMPWLLSQDCNGPINCNENPNNVGTQGLGEPLQSLQINLVSKGKGNDLDKGEATNVPTPFIKAQVYYSTQIQYKGWLEPVSNGAMSGTEGEGLRLEGMGIGINGDIAKYLDIYYQTQVQNQGWQTKYDNQHALPAVQGWAKNGQMAGTKGEGLKFEAMRVQLGCKWIDHIIDESLNTI